VSQILCESQLSACNQDARAAYNSVHTTLSCDTLFPPTDNMLACELPLKGGLQAHQPFRLSHSWFGPVQLWPPPHLRLDPQGTPPSTRTCRVEQCRASTQRDRVVTLCDVLPGLKAGASRFTAKACPRKEGRGFCSTGVFTPMGTARPQWGERRHHFIVVEDKLCHSSPT
jgi:hypothetical protein